MADNLETLTFELLKSGMIGLSPAVGAYLAESASVCLEQLHKSGVPFGVNGDISRAFKLVWEVIGDQQFRAHADLQEATEFGACGIAILIARIFTGKVVVSRSRKGTGFDYWLGSEEDKDGLFQGKARLEVSGILSGDESQINARLRMKLDQTSLSDKTGFPAYVSIVEFGSPRARFITKRPGVRDDDK